MPVRKHNLFYVYYFVLHYAVLHSSLVHKARTLPFICIYFNTYYNEGFITLISLVPEKVQCSDNKHNNVNIKKNIDEMFLFGGLAPIIECNQDMVFCLQMKSCTKTLKWVPGGPGIWLTS